MIIALTGHREQRLGLPSDVSTKEWEPIRSWIRKQIIDSNATEVFSGMAGGSDLAIAYEVAKMKEEGHRIKLTCVFPCKGYGTKSKHYSYIVGKADRIVNIHPKWQKGCDDDRDQYLVNHCNILLAVFDGQKTGGVYSTIRKAEKIGKPIIYCDVLGG